MKFVNFLTKHFTVDQIIGGMLFLLVFIATAPVMFKTLYLIFKIIGGIR